MQQLSLFGDSNEKIPKIGVTNVASIPQRSPFRYPRGKTWFVPLFRLWMSQFKAKDTRLIEPFAGGGILSLTAAFENLSNEIIMVELDEEVAAVWQAIFDNSINLQLANKILNFDLTLENIKIEFDNESPSLLEKAFVTILKNRVLHGGIITKGAGFMKNGENGKGLASRWYPKTLKKRIEAILLIKDKIKFISGDAFAVIKDSLSDTNNVYFIDPPYMVAGKRLYTHSSIDHEALFQLCTAIKGNFLMTYDDTEEVRNLAIKYKIPFLKIPMKTTHHIEKYELLLSNKLAIFTTD